MKSKTTLVTVFSLFFVLLCSCGGKIPVTGDNIVPPTNTAAETPSAPFTQTGQPTAETAELSTPTASPVALACTTPLAIIKTATVSLRDGPDLRFPDSAQYKKGDQFTVLGRYKDWFQVEALNGSMGWLHTDSLEFPSNIDIDTLCSFPADQLPPTPLTTQTVNQQKTPQSGVICEPTYYVSCP
jgi:hypothetical protein